MTARKIVNSESADSLVREWLLEYKALSEAELHTYASTVRLNDDLTRALYHTLLTKSSHDELAPICHQLHQFYRSTSHIDLKRFAVECIPTLIQRYLTSLSRREGGGAVEALLLAIYNLEVVDKDGSQKVKSCTIPSLSKPSVYHDPGNQIPLTLIESSLTQHQDQHQLVTLGPFPHIERLNASNRHSVLTFVLHCYNSQISELGLLSHRSLCQACTALCQIGFEALYKLDCDSSTSLARVSLSGELLLEAVSGLYYVMYNTLPTEGVQALNAVGQRARYELFTDVIMVCEAVGNSLQIAAAESGEKIQLLSTATPKPLFNKAAITNASFKTKKLPDDIPVVSDDEEPANDLDMAETSARHDRRMSETDKVQMSDKMKMAIKSALKKTEDRMKKEKRAKIALHTSANGNDSDNERRMSIGHLTAKSDSVELKSYTAADHKWSSLDEDSSRDLDSVTFQTNRKPPNVPTINTEV